MKIRMSPTRSEEKLVVVIHESAHAVAARSVGLGVRRIVMRGLRGMMYGRDDDAPHETTWRCGGASTRTPLWLPLRARWPSIA
jgi:hypothetical protein